MSEIETRSRPVLDLRTATWIESSGLGSMTQSGSVFADFNCVGPVQIVGTYPIKSRIDVAS